MPDKTSPDTSTATLGEPVAAPSANALGRAEVIARQVYAVSRLTPSMMLANIAAAVATVLVLHMDGLMTGWSLAWAGLLISVALYMLGKWLRAQRRPFPRRMTRRTLNRVVCSCVLIALFWAASGLVFLPQTQGAAQAVLIVIAAGMVAGGSMSLYPIPAATYLFAGIIAGGHAVGFLMGDSREVWPFLIVSVAYFYTVHTAIQRHRNIFVSEFVARRELVRKNAVIESLLEEARSETRQERRRSAARLERAQRLEMVSQLTAGIAHDFNNLLAGIQGSAELLELEGKADPSLLTPILEATDRGARLTSSLLTFASKRRLSPRTVQFEQSLALSSSVLQQTLGRDIRVETSIAPNLWPIRVDPKLTEHVVLSLAMNARDAMPEGGLFRITADNHVLPEGVDGDDAYLPPGGYVRLRFTDTGLGMVTAVTERAFEPFFTTKPFGQSSGLGLSTVYGFVQQSGGHVSIDSLPGRGTTVQILLPRAPETARDAATLPETVEVGRGESVLLIENDPAVMRSVAQMLRSLNYNVVEATDADTARWLLRGTTPPDLVVSDIRLGTGDTGPELAAEMERDGIAVPFAFITGSAEPLARDTPERHHHRAPVLTKPFFRSELSEFVRGVLGPGGGLGGMP